MKDSDTKSRFIELRTKNWSYNRIAVELKVSKQTLITWSRELSHVIANLRAIELEELQEKYLALREKRIELFGETLNSIRAELSNRDMKDVPTDKLLFLLQRFSEALKKESSETVFTIEEDTGLESMFGETKHVSRWKA